MAVTVPAAPATGEVVKGTSLWQDAWRRLRKNRLAVAGLVVVGFVVLASLVGPPIIEWTTGYTYDYIPRDAALIRAMPPFTAPDGSFSWTHPMGTDNAGRDILARVLLGGRISLMVGLISTLVSLIIGVTYGATAGYLGRPHRRSHDARRGRAVCAALHDDRHRAPGDVRRAVAVRPADSPVHFPRRRLLADDGADRPRARSSR